MVALAPWALAIAIAFTAGITDFRSRRIPNGLTVPGLILGIAANAGVHGWPGARDALLGAAAALAVLLPFVLVRSLGAGDWKFMVAIGGCVGLHHLIPVLFITLLANGILAFGMIVYKRRTVRAMHNMWDMLRALVTLHAPPSELTLDNPDAVKVPFGVAAALAIVLYSAHQIWSSQ